MMTEQVELDIEKELLSFYDSVYTKTIQQRKDANKKRITISFKEIIGFNPDLGDYLIDNPEDFILKSEAIIQHRYDVDMWVRIKDIPDVTKRRIRDIRSDMLGKLWTFEGIIESKSDVKPHIGVQTFECQNCGNLLSVIQTTKILKEPSKCPKCAKKGKFSKIERKMYDAYTMKLQELPENVNYDPELKRLLVFAKNDLAQINIEEKVFQGIRVKISGILKEVEVVGKKGEKSTQMDYVFDANYIDITENSFFDYVISDRDMIQIREIASQKDALRLLGDKVFCQMYGSPEVKQALILQQFGGVSNYSVTPKQRGEIHVLMIGDPGEGKTDFMRIQMEYALKSSYASGVTSTDVGLYGAVKQDLILGGWTYVAGPVVLCNNGICCLDEFNQMEKDQKSSLLEPMESSTVTISKADVHRQMNARTSMLVSANPKQGSFDKFQTVYGQFDIPTPVMNRFDLSFVFHSKSDPEKEYQKALLIMNRTKKKVEMEPLLFKKYVSFAKKINPTISQELNQYISKLYAETASNVKRSGDANSFPISPRMLNSIRRMSEALARVRLSSEVSKEDINYVMSLIHESLKQSQVDPETGKIDISLINMGVSTTQVSLASLVTDVIIELSASNKVIPIQDIVDAVSRKGSYPIHMIDEVLEKIKRKGDIFEPRHGFVQRI